MKSRRLYYIASKCSMNSGCELSRYYPNWLWRHRLYKKNEAFHLSKPFFETENEPSLYKIIL